MRDKISWLMEYATWREKVPAGVPFRDRMLCPCCFMPTLTARARYEICAICFWEDDGQDDPQADEYLGGPNHGLSLTRARENFAEFGTMYAPTDTVHYAEQMPTAEQRNLYYRAMHTALKQNTDENWKAALKQEKQYRGFCRKLKR